MLKSSYKGSCQYCLMIHAKNNVGEQCSVLNTFWLLSVFKDVHFSGHWKRTQKQPLFLSTSLFTKRIAAVG